jgi:hypothetical protein
MAIVGLQSCAVYLGGAAFEQQGAEQGEATGLVVALFLLLGAAFALTFPLVSVVAFLLAGIFGIGAGGPFKDLVIWGYVSLALAVLSFFGWREKRKRREESESRVR